MDKVIFLGVIFFLVAAVSATCKVDPKLEMTWDKSFICNTAEAYPSKIVEWALQMDVEAQRFLNHVSTIFDTVAEQATIMRSNWYCNDVCPETLNNLTAVFHPVNGKICYVVRPWQQRITYIGCGTKTCQIVNNFSPNYYCIPDGFIKREILVYCPYMLPQCQKMTVKIPTACSCKNYSPLSCNDQMSKNRGLASRFLNL